LTGNVTGNVTGNLNGLSYPSSDGTNGQVLTTNGSGTLSFSTISGYTDSDVETYLNTSEIYTDATNNYLGVGSGASTPSYVFHVQKSVANGTLAKLQNASNTASDVLLLNTAGTGSGTNILDVQSGGSTKFLVRGDGNVGIGNTSPAYILDVIDTTGNAYISISRGTQSQGEVGFKLEGGTSGGDWYIYQPTSSNDLRFYQGSDKVTIDSSGNVGIGTDNPAEKLHIAASSYTAPTGGLDDNINLLINNSQYCGIQILGSSTGSSFIHFGDQDNADVGLITYEHNGDYMRFDVNATERMRITSSGYVEMASASQVRLTLGNEGTAGTNTANWVRGTGNELGFNSAGGGFHWEIGGTERMRILSSGGITFNGDTASANALDDYEEGTWDPVLTQGNYGTIGRLSSVYKGRYQKIGSVVHFQIYSRYDFSVVSAGSRTGDIDISLPFTQGGGTQQYNAIYISYLSNFLSSNVTNIGGYIISGDSRLTIKVEDYSGAESNPTISGSNNAGIMVAGFYYTYDI